ncbi:hypothetical protein [Vibrio sp. TBV020]|uniref:hypothetical protein n=1 Tax=Vibrio sp. TBV020 TaxID=3137398 RepID=UPI0038CD960F
MGENYRIAWGLTLAKIKNIKPTWKLGLLRFIERGGFVDGFDMESFSQKARLSPSSSKALTKLLLGQNKVTEIRSRTFERGRPKSSFRLNKEFLLELQGSYSQYRTILGTEPPKWKVERFINTLSQSNGLKDGEVMIFLVMLLHSDTQGRIYGMSQTKLEQFTGHVSGSKVLRNQLSGLLDKKYLYQVAPGVSGKVLFGRCTGIYEVKMELPDFDAAALSRRDCFDVRSLYQIVFCNTRRDEGMLVAIRFPDTYVREFCGEDALPFSDDFRHFMLESHGVGVIQRLQFVFDEMMVAMLHSGKGAAEKVIKGYMPLRGGVDERSYAFLVDLLMSAAMRVVEKLNDKGLVLEEGSPGVLLRIGGEDAFSSPPKDMFISGASFHSTPNQ